MPLVRRGPAPGRDTGPPPEALLDALRDSDPDIRWHAARALPPEPGLAAAIGAALAAETEAPVREALFSALVRIGDAAPLIALLREDDAALRRGALDALSAMPEAMLPLLPGLLADPDPDMRIAAVELVRFVERQRASDWLAALLERDTLPNACAAATEVLAELGTATALPALRHCKIRFADQPFLQFACDTAMRRIAGR